MLEISVMHRQLKTRFKNFSTLSLGKKKGNVLMGVASEPYKVIYRTSMDQEAKMARWVWLEDGIHAFLKFWERGV